MERVDRYVSDRSEEIADRQSKGKAMVSELFSHCHVDVTHGSHPVLFFMLLTE